MITLTWQKLPFSRIVISATIGAAAGLLILNPPKISRR